MSPIEKAAHDIVCIVKYGSVSGGASSGEIKRVVAYLQQMNGKPSPPPMMIPPRMTTPPPMMIPPR